MAKRTPLKRVPLHRQVAEILRQEIDKLQPGDRLDAESKLASRFDVSVLTVREALSALAQEGLLERRHGSGTYVAEPDTNKHVAVFIDLDISHPQTSYFFLRITQQVRRYLDSKKIPNRLYAGHCLPGGDVNTEPICQEIVDDLEREVISGMIVISSNPRAYWTKYVNKQKLPVVGGMGLGPVVDLGYSDAIEKGLKYLVVHGRKRIATFGCPGYNRIPEILERLGIEANPQWLCDHITPHMEKTAVDEFTKIFTASGERPNGLLVGDDIVFKFLSTAILELKIQVPDELMIVAHANKGVDYRLPFPVMRMETDPDAYALKLGELMEKLLNGEEVAEHETVELDWIEARGTPLARNDQ